MISGGRLERDLLEIMRNEQKLLFEELINNPVLLATKWESIIRKRNHLSVKIHREKQARGEAPTIKTLGTEYFIQDTAINHQHHTPYN